MTEAVTLRDGRKVSCSVLTVLFMSLEEMKDEEPVIFLQLALRTKNPKHRWLPGYEEKALKWFPNMNHDDVKAVLQNSIGGSLWEPRLQNPRMPASTNESK